MGDTSPSTQKGDSDTRPIAVRRKRRSSAGLVDPVINAEHMKSESLSLRRNVSYGAKTPTKAKKRVRFSDPGSSLAESSSSSTGLTPYLKRSSLAPMSPSHPPSRSRILRKGPRGRRSLPNLTASLPSPSLSPPPNQYISGEIQFMPMRQILDDRLKRRLRRNNMSEVINDIETEKKSQSRWEQEVQGLKDELALARQLGIEVNDSIEDEQENIGRVQALEEELAILKQEKFEQPSTISSYAVAAVSEQSSPTTSTYDDANATDSFIMVNFDENGAIRDGRATAITQMNPTTTEATTQVSLLSQSDIATFRSARLALEHLFPGENPIGLETDDLGLIFETVFNHVRSLKGQVILAENALATSKNLESNLRTKFNAVLQQLDRARIHAEGLTAQIVSEKTRGDESDKKLQQLEIGIEMGTERIKGLETSIDEKERSIQKLQDALEAYRVEVSKLETLVNRLEGEYLSKVSDLENEMKETVADLECRATAETTGRRASEKEAVERGERIKQLEQSEIELKAVVTEKQKIIRALEGEITKESEGREKEIGVLNVKIGELAAGLEGVSTDLVKMEREKKKLQDRVSEEKTAGIKAVEVVRSELARCVDRVDGITQTHMRDVRSRGAEVSEHRGLLTPVSACRFKDIEGYVEVKRGKSRKRPDSGIGILEELEDEDLMVEGD